LNFEWLPELFINSSPSDVHVRTSRKIYGADSTPLRRLPDHRVSHDFADRRHNLADHPRGKITEPFNSRQIYFPGEGLLLVIALLYLLGLTLTSVVGRWVWNTLDSGVSRLPGLGLLYRTLKQILGFDAGEGALFQRVVLVPDESTRSMEIGLVTASAGDAEAKHLTVFVPCSPNPSQGRLLRIPASSVITTDWTVDKALKALFSLGKI